MVLTATADTFIDSSYPDSNYGSNTILEVKPTTQRILFTFDLSGENNGLTSAYLYVKDFVAVNPYTLTIRRITSSWVEGNVTWNTTPTFTATNEMTHVLSGVHGWHQINVTQLIIDCINNTNYGISFYNITTGNESFYSRESSGNEPYLVVNYGEKFVDIATGSDVDDGNSWANAYLTIKKGIDNITASNTLHIAEGDYSAQAAITLDKNLEMLCEDYGGGNANPPLTVVLPVTA